MLIERAERTAAGQIQRAYMFPSNKEALERLATAGFAEVSMTNLPANVHTQAWLSMTTEPTRLAAGHSAQCSVGRTTADSDSVRTAAAPMGSTATCNTASHTAHNQDPRLPFKIPIWKTVAELLQWWENGSGARTEGTPPFPPMRSWTDKMVEEHRSTFREEREKTRFNKNLYTSALDYLIFSQMVQAL